MPASHAVQAHLGFALAVHRALATPGQNNCFSPYSLASALGLVTRAARGDTAAEPATLLSGSPEGAAEQAELLRDSAVLEPPGPGEQAPEFAVSNTLWVWRELEVKPGFVAELRAWPSGGMATAPFVADPEAARSAINRDVADTTRELIPELLPPGAVGGDTVAALVNALYLRAGWTTAFRESDTEDGDFHSPAGTARVPMMRQAERLGYAAHAGWQLVDLPAAGGLAVSVLLPDRPLAEAEPELTAETVAELLAARREAMVRVSLPRLSLDVRAELKGVLHSLGVHRMFEPGADFGELSDDPRLLVSDVMHQSVLRVDESGLEGAAATAVMMRLVSAPAGEPVTVTVDRPFLLLVRHRTTGAVYFLARVVEP
ncbi:serpin family protein [Saccharomonospora piscinae]|uniref:serpin family protein n=1 Tax=Saccharomonospora piscinae TaxID=687388 RepID=UPI000467445F|nr:serpin family protein [Saccharomonospora piscinae]